jgi:sec-independent protein translocase protein TatC
MADEPRPDATLDDRPEDDVEMTFFEHLGELRVRLVRSLIAFVPGMGVGWLFKEYLLEALLRPVIHAYVRLGLGEPEIHFANPIDPFVGYLMLSAGAGLILSAPWVFWQLWAFISPGLYRREKLLAMPFVLVSTAMFIGGVAFGYFIVFDLAFETFLGFAGELPGEAITMVPTLMLRDYISFATRMLAGFGVTFEVPVVVTFLAFAGIVNWRQLVGFARWWMLASAFIAALLTPPDVGSQLLMFVPLNVLYWVSILLAYFFGPKVQKPGATTEDGYER